MPDSWILLSSLSQVCGFSTCFGLRVKPIFHPYLGCFLVLTLNMGSGEFWEREDPLFFLHYRVNRFIKKKKKSFYTRMIHLLAVHKSTKLSETFFPFVLWALDISLPLIPKRVAGKQCFSHWSYKKALRGKEYIVLISDQWVFFNGMLCFKCYLENLQGKILRNY